MNYPIWEIPTIGGGSFIALIAILHVYIAHLAVGGGMFIWISDLVAGKRNDRDMLAYVKKHTKFFLLLTMVFGGVTGVGIWFIIGLVHPAATSKLIHAFVFGWAIEWVFFLGEITALLVYHYQFDRLEEKTRQNIAFLYALFAWLSLFIINGILSFMLTPGSWLETQNFWHGFFNPTFFPSLFFRSFMSMIIAGLFGYVTTVFLRDSAFRTRMLRYCSKWLLYPFAGLVPSAVWYYYAVPGDTRILAFILNPQTAPMVNITLITSIIIFLFGLYFMMKSGAAIQRILVFVLVLVGLFWMGGFEYTREVARKPYVLGSYMYSTSIMTGETDQLNAEGVLKQAKWTPIKRIEGNDPMEAGRELFNIQCLSCHTVNGIRNDVVSQTDIFSYNGVMALLTGQGKVNPYMPVFVGTEAEKEALAMYITSELAGKEIIRELDAYQGKSIASEIPPFDMKKSDYVLLAWNDLGMHCLFDGDPWFSILPPANTLEAQLIKRGATPSIVTEGVELTFAVEPGFEHPSRHVAFWEYSEQLFGAKLEDNVGLAGLGMQGAFDINEDSDAFIAKMIPVVPYKDDGTYNAYPLFKVEARDAASGELLAETQVVAPTSSEIGCINCHGGDWGQPALSSGMGKETALNILQAHDRLSGTDLYEQALDGKPTLCQSCHADPAIGAEGKEGTNNLSTSMHGFHANYMHVQGAEACAMCHPARAKGSTRCSRGVHNSLGIDCIDCHGTMDEHGLALLKGQIDNPSSERMMKHLETTHVASVDEVNPRAPWLNQPDCMNCHEDYEQPVEGVNAFNTWTEGGADLYRMRTDNVGIRCEACHGAPHALYAAINPFEAKRDVLQPLQYSGEPYPIGSNMKCAICHMQEMEFPIHHENMLRPVRNPVAVK